jgi:membrane-anchored protein YejM (alkaline phosphatase superfamily)
LSKFEAEPPSKLSIFLEYMEPLFEKNLWQDQWVHKSAVEQSKQKEMKDDKKNVLTQQKLNYDYFALVILTSQVRKSHIQLYWSKNRCIDMPIFRKTMGRKSFKIVSRFLHFTHDQHENNKLRKIRPIA